MTIFQLGSRRAAIGFRGNGDLSTVVCMEYFLLGLYIPCLLRVTTLGCWIGELVGEGSICVWAGVICEEIGSGGDELGSLGTLG